MYIGGKRKTSVYKKNVNTIRIPVPELVGEKAFKFFLLINIFDRK